MSSSSLKICKLFPVTITQRIPQQKRIQGLTGSFHVALQSNKFNEKRKSNYYFGATSKTTHIYLLFAVLQKGGPAVEILRIVVGNLPKSLEVCRHFSLFLLFSFSSSCGDGCRQDAWISSICSSALLLIRFGKVCIFRLIMFCQRNTCIRLNSLQFINCNEMQY